MYLDAVFWDFDGVVLDSVDVKTCAFGKMFGQHGPNVQKAVVEYHLMNGGVSRFEKFKYFYRNILKCPLGDGELDALGRQFSSLVLEEVLSAPFMPGAYETLQYLKKRSIPCYVVSGTPDGEIKKIVDARKLGCFFQEVHGSPSLKEDILKDIICRKGYSLENCVFLGDAMTDYKAAKKVGTKFIGIIKDGCENFFPDDTFVAYEVKVRSDY